MTAELSLLFCPECGRDCLAEAPPCTDGPAGDGHGDHAETDCPERVCVECGTAVLLDVPLFALGTQHASGRRHAA